MKTDDDPFNFAEIFRYSEDISSNKIDNVANSSYEISEVHNSLLINSSISPLIFDSLERVSNNLKINVDKINLYVFSSGEINARCFNGVNGGFVIILSSKIIEILDGLELDFVIGHELGHLLLKHTQEERDSSPEGLKLSRAKEISVDRIGLVACQDLDSTMRAIMKTISGLPSKYLNFNFSEFMNQIRIYDLDSSKILERSSHPSFLIRARALMHFSGSDIYQALFQSDGKIIQDVDKQIKREMDKFIDKTFNEEIIERENNFEFWLSSFAAISKNSLSKEDQELIKKHYGNDKLNKFKSLIMDRSSNEVLKIVQEKLLESFAKLSEMKSASIDKDLRSSLDKISKIFKVENLIDKFSKLFE